MTDGREQGGVRQDGLSTFSPERGHHGVTRRRSQKEKREELGWVARDLLEEIVPKLPAELDRGEVRALLIDFLEELGGNLFKERSAFDVQVLREAARVVPREVWASAVWGRLGSGGEGDAERVPLRLPGRRRRRSCGLRELEELHRYTEELAAKLREEVFGPGQRKPRFKSAKEAEGWLDREAKAGGPPGELATPAQQALEELQRRLESVRGTLPPYCELRLGMRLVLVSWPGRAPFPATTPQLRRLAAAAERLAGDRPWDWGPGAATAFLLLGVGPMAPTWAVLEEPFRLDREVGLITWRRLRVVFQPPEVTWADLEALYEALRQRGLAGGRGRRPSAGADHELLRFVDERRQAAFPPLDWREVLDDWNAAHPERRFAYSKGLMRAYRRARERAGLERPEPRRGVRRSEAGTAGGPHRAAGRGPADAEDA